MSLQIRDIVLYSRKGEMRRIPLQIGKVNIIAGGSGTGKSALIQIVDYCFGSKACYVPDGAIRDLVSWYALRLQHPSGQLFVARKVPDAGFNSSGSVYYESAIELEVPTFDAIIPNCDTSTLIALLTRIVGIGENLHEPPDGQTRLPLSANVRHSLFYVFQPQDKINSKKHLFHNQSEEYIPQTIKDTLPYFLGAIPDDHVVKKNRFRILRDRLRDRERKLTEIEAIQGGVGKASTLLAEAQDIGLAQSIAELGSWDEVISALRAVVTSPAELPANSVESGGKLQLLLNEKDELFREYRRIREQIGAVRSMLAAKAKFAYESKEQIARLKSIDLYKPLPSANHTCPVCQSELKDQIPTVSAIQASITTLARQLGSLSEEAPLLGGAIKRLEEQAAEIKQRMNMNRELLDALRDSDDRVSTLLDDTSRRAVVIGRISLYLESVPSSTNRNSLRNEVERLRQQHEALKEELSNQIVQERIASISNQLGIKMTKLTSHLDFEYSDYPLRFDINRLNVIADKPSGPVPLERMGSAENWVGHHLIVHLALHDWFITQNRPVPRFLFLDQLSQVYFPIDNDDEDIAASVKAEDRDAVESMFKMVFGQVERLAPNLQVIITEHADLKQPWYRDAIAERWRGDTKLIPLSWFR